MRQIDRFAPGAEYDHRELNRALKATERNYNLLVEPPLEMIGDEGNQTLRIIPLEIFAVIEGDSSSSSSSSDSSSSALDGPPPHAWREVRPKGNGHWQRTELFGTKTRHPAYEFNWRTIDPGVIVRMYRGYGQEWLFEQCCTGPVIFDSSSLSSSSVSSSSSSHSSHSSFSISSNSSLSSTCVCNIFPNTYTMEVGGFGGDCEGFNGAWTLTRSGCSYTGTLGDSVGHLTLNSSGGGNVFTLIFDDGFGDVAVYTAEITNPNCCVNLVFSYSTGNCDTHPHFIVLRPGSPCSSSLSSQSSHSSNNSSSSSQGIGGDCLCQLPSSVFAIFSGPGCLNGVVIELLPNGPTELLSITSQCGGNTLLGQIDCDGFGQSPNLIVHVSCVGGGPPQEIACPSRPWNFSLTFTLACDSPIQTYTVTFTE